VSQSCSTIVLPGRRPAVLSCLRFDRGRTYLLFEDIISYPYPGPKKDVISYHYHGKKRIWIYVLYPLSKNLPALSQFLNNKKPDLVALQHTILDFIPDRIKSLIYQQRSAARKWQITAEMAETAVLKEKYCL
jgi:hypothetical protein